MRRTTATLATALVTGTLAAVTVGGAPASAAKPSFYTPPTTLPAANGAIVRSLPQRLAVKVPGIIDPGTATRIMYKSTDENGQRVAVTGSFIKPRKKWKGKGARPLVAFAPGTQGQGDACAPSKTLSTPLNVEKGSIGTGYEVPNLYSFLERGVAVVVTDYVGLGTTDRIHTYTDRADMGHALLDAARAAKNLKGSGVTSSSPIGLYGYSQGGGATGAAAELAPTYAPELKLKGAYVGAPPADLFEVLKTIDKTTLTGAIGYAINGLVSYRPELKTVLDAETNDAGKAALAAVSTQCTVQTALSFGFKSTSEWTKSGETAAQLVARIPEAKAAVDAQRLGLVKPKVPTLVYSGTQDDIVAHSQVKTLVGEWCELGANVQYRPVPQALSSGGSGLNHITPAFSKATAARTWLLKRLSGVKAPSNCATASTLP